MSILDMRAWLADHVLLSIALAMVLTAVMLYLVMQALREFDLRLAFEDDPRNVSMFHAQGVPCIYIHSGYYE
ncbi:MAG: hypothetical protein HC834_05945 [Rhodospirillales bacterium]|nr:hypothetical protein [Rhodospirillales bacterium]